MGTFGEAEEISHPYQPYLATWERGPNLVRSFDSSEDVYDNFFPNTTLLSFHIWKVKLFKLL